MGTAPTDGWFVVQIAVRDIYWTQQLLIAARDVAEATAAAREHVDRLRIIGGPAFLVAQAQTLAEFLADGPSS